MKLSYISSLTVFAIAAAIQTPALGSTLTFASGDGTNEGNLNRTLTPFIPITPGANVTITPHGVWEPNHAVAKWISYSNTGLGGTSPFNNFISSPYFLTSTANFLEAFTLTPMMGNVTSAFLSVWADDTAAVYVNTSLIATPNGVQDGACADGVIGCEPGEGLVNFNIAPYLQTGLNVITVSAFQRGGGPFGVLYEGSVETDKSAVPEPATMGLLGAGLIAITFVARKRKNTSA